MVIVSGASGFVGLSVVKALIQQGIEVLALLRNPEKVDLFSSLSGVTPLVLEMKEILSLPAILTRNKIPQTFEGFFHFAWDGNSGAGREDYTLQLQNIQETCDAVELCATLQIPQFIYAGSLMEYESTSYIPVSGSKPVRNYLYRTGKLTGHYMAKTVAVSRSIDFKMGIISNAYGAGEYSPRLINSSLRKLLAGEPTSFTSGEQLYDFIYITDVAKAFVAIFQQGKPYHNYYIGNSTQKPLKEFIQEMGDCVKPNLDLGIGRVPFDGVSIDYHALDTKSLYRDTDFTPQVSFSQGIAHTIQWIQEVDSSS